MTVLKKHFIILCSASTCSNFCLFVCFIFKDSGILHVSSVSPTKPMHFSPSKPTLTEIPGNTRPGLDVPLSEKLDGSGLRANASKQVTNKTVPLNNGSDTVYNDAKLKPAPLHNSSLTLSNVKESFPGILSSSQAGKPAARTSSGTLPAATSSKVPVISPHRQLVEIPQTSRQNEGLSYKSKEPNEPRLATLHNYTLYVQKSDFRFSKLPSGKWNSISRLMALEKNISPEISKYEDNLMRYTKICENFFPNFPFHLILLLHGSHMP